MHEGSPVRPATPKPLEPLTNQEKKEATEVIGTVGEREEGKESGKEQAREEKQSKGLGQLNGAEDKPNAGDEEEKKVRT